MNIEKALAFDERIQEMNIQREKMELDLLATNAQVRHQDFILKHYQEVMHEKEMLKRDMVSEMEAIRRDRLAARKAVLETKNVREELELEKKKAFMDRRAKELQQTKKEMVNIVKNYFDYKSTVGLLGHADEKSPFPAEININKSSTNIDAVLKSMRGKGSESYC